MFVDGKDFIAHPSYEDAQKIYLEYIDKGWVPMTREDLNETCYFSNICYVTGLRFTRLLQQPAFCCACTKTRALARAMCVRIFRIFRRRRR